MNNVILIGSRGYHKNYGGWETFVDNLIDNWEYDSFNFHVYEITESQKTQYIDKKNVKCPQIYQKNIGSATMLLFSIKSVLHSLKYIKNNRLKNPIIYIIGLRIGPLMWMLKHSFKKRGIKIIINPDGLEWKRSKWNKLIKLYFKFSERTMIRSSDLIICDSMGIKEYIKTKYNPKATLDFIPYGYDLDLNKDKEKAIEFLNKYHIIKNNYYLIVGRFVPENNYEMMISAFMQSKTKKSLLIISNFDRNSKFYQQLKVKTSFDVDDRIIFSESLYDKPTLMAVREMAYAYMHGHSVGGTNPSLLESLGNTSLNIVYDVNFNREVCENSALYFNSKNSLTEILNNIDNISKEEIINFENKAKNRIKQYYSWKLVIDKHYYSFDSLFKKGE